jgi:inhibitor of KinA
MHDYSIYALGDRAVTLSLGNTIDDDKHNRLMATYETLSQNPVPGVLDITVAYSSITISFDLTLVRKTNPGMLASDAMKKRLVEAYTLSAQHAGNPSAKLWRVPVCYDPPFAYDIDELSSRQKISREQIIALHTSRTYRIYMIGFLPGFPYMASVAPELRVARKPRPRPVVEAGSVGLAGEQTGIYPVNSPGGWQIIGRTPVTLFDKNADPPVWLKPGDKVQFFQIPVQEFGEYNSGAK